MNDDGLLCVGTLREAILPELNDVYRRLKLLENGQQELSAALKAFEQPKSPSRPLTRAERKRRRIEEDCRRQQIFAFDETCPKCGRRYGETHDRHS